METRKVTTIALALVLLASSMLVCFNNQGTDPDDDISNTHFTPLSSEILDGVEDGDGFGFDISLGMNDAYDLLRSALSETDVEYYASNEKGSEYLDLVAAIQKYESYEELCLTEFLEYIDITADLLVDVNVSSHPEDMRVLSIVIDLQIYMEEFRDFSEEYVLPALGFEENEFPYKKEIIRSTETYNLDIFVSHDIINDIKFSRVLTMDHLYECNFAEEETTINNMARDCFVEIDTIFAPDSMINITEGRIDLKGISTLTELMDHLVAIDSEKTVVLEARLFDTYMTGYMQDRSDTSPLIYCSQADETWEYEIPAGMLAAFFAQYDIDMTEYMSFYNILKVLVDEGLVYDSAYIVLKKAGIDITEEQYNVLVALAKEGDVPNYEIMSQILDKFDLSVDEATYDYFCAVMGCLQGDLNYENMRDVLFLMGIKITLDQYNIMKSAIDAGEPIPYSTFSEVYGELCPITEVEYNSIVQLMEDGTLPAYAVIAPYLTTMSEEDYNKFVSIYDTIRNDPSYENINPILMELGVPLTEEEFDLIMKLLTDRDSVCYDDLSFLFEAAGLELTEEQYNRLLEIYVEMQSGITIDMVIEILGIFDVIITEEQCELIILMITEAELPEYKDMAPILEILGLDVPEEVYNELVKRFELLSTAPGYLGTQILLEDNGMFISEEQYEDMFHVLVALQDGVDSIKSNPDKVSSYVDWKDLSRNPEMKDQIRNNAKECVSYEKIPRLLKSDGDYSVVITTFEDDIDISNFGTEGDVSGDMEAIKQLNKYFSDEFNEVLKNFGVEIPEPKNVTITLLDSKGVKIDTITQVAGRYFVLEGYRLYEDAELSIPYRNFSIDEDTTLYVEECTTLEFIRNGNTSRINATDFEIKDGWITTSTDNTWYDQYLRLNIHNETQTTVGWYVIDNDEEMMLPDGKYKASEFENIPIYCKLGTRTYTLTLNVDPEKGTCSERYITREFGEQITELPEVEAKPGYRFVGWVTGYTIVDSICLRMDDAIYAGFVRTGDPKVTITLDVDSVAGYVDETIVERNSGDIVLSLPEAYANEGFTFLGWYSDDVEIHTPFIVRENMTLEAKFQHLTLHDIVFISDGEVFHRSKQYSGFELVLPNDVPTKVSTAEYNYTFDRWAGYTEGMRVTGDVTFEATFTSVIREYTATFMTGDVPKTIVVEYGSEIPENEVPAVPSKESTAQYDFNGTWKGYTAGYVMTGDVIFEPIYESKVRSYSVKFYINHSDTEPFSTQTVQYGEYAKLPTAIPIKEPVGNVTYAFAGWGDLTTIVGDTKYFAIFIEGKQDIKEDGSTTTTIVEGNKTTTTDYATDGSSTIEEKFTEEVEEDNKVITTDTVIKVEKDNKGEEISSIEKKDVKEESKEEVFTKTETKESNKDGEKIDTTIMIESKDSDVTTSAQIQIGTDDSKSFAESNISSSDNNEVKDSDIETALKQLERVEEEATNTDSGITVDKTVTVQTTGETKDKASTTISAESLDKISDINANLLVKGEVGTIKIGSDVAGSLSSKATTSNESVSVSIATADKDDMTEAQKRVVKDHTVIQLTATVGETYVHELGGIATITIPYELKDGETKDNIVVFFINDEGEVSKKVTTYDVASGTITFETDHFSYYIVSQEMGLGSPDDDGDDDGSNTVMHVGISAAVVAVLVALTFIVIRRKA